MKRFNISYQTTIEDDVLEAFSEELGITTDEGLIKCLKTIVRMSAESNNESIENLEITVDNSDKGMVN